MLRLSEVQLGSVLRECLMECATFSSVNCNGKHSDVQPTHARLQSHLDLKRLSNLRTPRFWRIEGRAASQVNRRKKILFLPPLIRPRKLSRSGIKASLYPDRLLGMNDSYCERLWPENDSLHELQLDTS